MTCREQSPGEVAAGPRGPPGQGLHPSSMENALQTTWQSRGPAEILSKGLSGLLGLCTGEAAGGGASASLAGR